MVIRVNQFSWDFNIYIFHIGRDNETLFTDKRRTVDLKKIKLFEILRHR